MIDLPAQILNAIRAENFLVSIHAGRQLRRRLVELWQVESGVDEWELLEIRPDDLPHPSIVCLQSLVDGTDVKVVWSWYAEEGIAILVTVHFLDNPP